MALANYLAQIKSAGIYRFVWDKSEMPPAEAQTMRLVVGYSEKGPFNTPVYVESKADFKKIFGAENKKLERYGVFFHRMALQALETGPILALNLKKFNDETVQYVKRVQTQTGVFDTEHIGEQLKEICITTTSPELACIPSIVNANCFEVVSVGKYEDENTLAVPESSEFDQYFYYPGLEQYFFQTYDSNNDPLGVGVAKIVGRNIEIESNTYLKIKITHNNPSGWDGYECYVTSAAEADNDTAYAIYTYDGTDLTDTGMTVKIYTTDVPSSGFDLEANYSLISGSTVDITDIPAGDIVYVISNPASETEMSYEYGDAVLPVAVSYPSSAFQLAPDTQRMNVEDIYNTDRFWSLEPKKLEANTATKNGYFVITETDEKKTSCTVIIRKAEVKGYDISFKDWYSQILNGTELPDYLGNGTDSMKDYFGEIYVFRGNLSQFAESDTLGQYFENGIIKNYITNAFGDQIDALEALAANPNSNFINKYTGILLPDFESANGTALSLDVLFNRDNALHNLMMNLNQTMLYGEEIPLEDIQLPVLTQKNSDMYYLEGYAYTPAKPTSNTQDDKYQWHKSVSFDTLMSYKGMRIGLTDRTSVEYHYLVDTWESYIGHGEIKADLVLIAKEKDNALALVNFPSVESIREVEGSVDQNNQIKWQDLIDNSNLKLAGYDNGASWAGYYTCVSLRNPATLVKFTCPAAALVSNDYMAKYVTRLPYSIVAGPNYGVISDPNLVGPDYNFSRSELDVLEPFGVNCLIYAPRIGTYINAQQTAKQNPVTALSKISTRELVIFIQDEIENLLRGYQWEFNTQALRNTIKSKADVILDTIKNNGGVYAYLNVCDESNNTDDVINNEMLILDTSIEPGMGCGKMVQQLTIYRKGGLTSLITE